MLMDLLPVAFGVGSLNYVIVTVGFLSKHAGSRRKRLTISANEATTQIFFIPPHKLNQFLDEASSLFTESRYLFFVSK